MFVSIAGRGGGSCSPGQTGREAHQADRQAGQVPGSALRGALQARPLSLLSALLCWGREGGGVGVLGGSTYRLARLHYECSFWLGRLNVSFSGIQRQ